MKLIDISRIGYDKKFYPRVNGKEDWLTVTRYKDALISHPWKADSRKKGAFPPVVLVRATGYDSPYLLLDGLHRLRAFHGAGQEKIWGNIERLPQSKWLARSVELNIAGQRPLDSGDKRWVASTLIADGWSKGEVAGLLEMQECSFERLISAGCQKLTKTQSEMLPIGRANRQINGNHYGFLKAPFLEATGTSNAVSVLESQSSVSSGEPRQIVDSFLALLESGLIDETDEYIAERMERIKELLG